MNYEVEDSKPGEACAACGSTTTERQLIFTLPPGKKRGVHIMLCREQGPCNRRSGVMAEAISGRSRDA